MTATQPTALNVPGPDVGDILVQLSHDYKAQDVVALLSSLFARGHYETAYHLAQSGFDRWSHDAAFLRIYRSVVTKMGELSEATYATYLLYRAKATSAHSVNLIQGRARELGGWRPTILAEPTKIVPVHERRILHLVKESRPYFSNGFTSRSHYNYLAELAAGLQPVVMTEPGSCRQADALAHHTRVEAFQGITHHHLDLGDVNYGQMPLDQYLNSFAELAYAKIKEIRPALIHVSSGRRGYETALVAAALKRHTGLPLVYEVRSFFEANWTSDVTREEQGELYQRRMIIENEMMDEADLVLTISKAMQEEMASRGIPSSKIGIIPNGVDVDLFTPVSRDSVLESRLGIRGLPTYGYVSNMDHYRESQETLIHAMRHLVDSGSDLRCVLVGDGPRRSQLEELAKTLGVEDRVMFTGSIEHSEIVKYYSLIDIFVVPRTRERAATYVTPLKPFEAMALRKPVIVSDLPALREIANPPARGLTFEPDDAEALANMLSKLHADTGRRESMAAAAYDWIHAERTWRQNGDRYVQYFTALTSVKVQ